MRENAFWQETESKIKKLWKEGMTKTTLSLYQLGSDKGRFCNNIETDTVISKRLSVENKAKVSQLETTNPSSAVLFI